MVEQQGKLTRSFVTAIGGRPGDVVAFDCPPGAAGGGGGGGGPGPPKPGIGSGGGGGGAGGVGILGLADCLIRTVHTTVE